MDRRARLGHSGLGIRVLVRPCLGFQHKSHTLGSGALRHGVTSLAQGKQQLILGASYERHYSPAGRYRKQNASSIELVSMTKTLLKGSRDYYLIINEEVNELRDRGLKVESRM